MILRIDINDVRVVHHCVQGGVRQVAGKDVRQLFVAHRRELQTYLTRKLRDADLAADLTQETFLRFAEQQGVGTAVVLHARSYLYRMAHNLAVDHIRQKRQKPLYALDDALMEDVASDAPSPEQVTAGQTELALVRKALSELPERSRQVFVLVRVRGLTYRQAAQELSISDSSVQKHLAKAIQHVMQQLRRG